LDIINKNDIETQEELVQELRRAGFNVTQATISRDIKELGMIKTMRENGSYKYTVSKKDDVSISNKLLNMYREAVLTLVVANNMVVVKTLVGSASAVAMVIDQLQFPEMFGTIAGDDTLIVIAKNNENAGILYEKLNSMVEFGSVE
jgi:transcriptional regulator of arginine metabolism